MTRKPQIGSISTGTLIPHELCDAFASELAYLLGTSATPDQRELLEAVDAMTGDDLEECDDLLEAITRELEDLAPEASYFGARDGDGADFGFWPLWEAVDELPAVKDPSEVEDHRGEPCKFVNDHGNVTVYNSDGSVAWDCV